MTDRDLGVNKGHIPNPDVGIVWRAARKIGGRKLISAAAIIGLGGAGAVFGFQKINTESDNTPDNGRSFAPPITRTIEPQEEETLIVLSTQVSRKSTVAPIPTKTAFESAPTIIDSLQITAVPTAKPPAEPTQPPTAEPTKEPQRTYPPEIPTPNLLTVTPDSKPTAILTATTYPPNTPVPPTATREPIISSCPPEFNGSFDISAGDRPQGWLLKTPLNSLNARYERQDSDGIVNLDLIWRPPYLNNAGIITDHLIKIDPTKTYSIRAEVMVDGAASPDLRAGVGGAIETFDKDGKPIMVINQIGMEVIGGVGGSVPLDSTFNGAWKTVEIFTIGPEGSGAKGFFPKGTGEFQLVVDSFIADNPNDLPAGWQKTVKVRKVSITCS